MERGFIRAMSGDFECVSALQSGQVSPGRVLWLCYGVSILNSGHYGKDADFSFHVRPNPGSPDNIGMRIVICQRGSNLFRFNERQITAAGDVDQCPCCAPVVDVKHWIGETFLTTDSDLFCCLDSPTSMVATPPLLMIALTSA